jgi:hypothetical protein
MSDNTSVISNKEVEKKLGKEAVNYIKDMIDGRKFENAVPWQVRMYELFTLLLTVLVIVGIVIGIKSSVMSGVENMAMFMYFSIPFIYLVYYASKIIRITHIIENKYECDAEVLNILFKFLNSKKDTNRFGYIFLFTNVLLFFGMVFLGHWILLIAFTILFALFYYKAYYNSIRMIQGKCILKIKKQIQKQERTV